MQMIKIQLDEINKKVYSEYFHHFLFSKEHGNVFHRLTFKIGVKLQFL